MITAMEVMVSIEESGLGRWSRLKKARKDRASSRNEATDVLTDDQAGEQVISRHGKASPTAYPTEVSGEYRPWLPPLTAEAGNVPAEQEGEQDREDGEPSEEVLNAEETAIAEEMELPDIETLKEGSDFSVFMKEGVPDKLRRLALRKLWSSNPLFGFKDGLNDYDEDFTALSDYVYNTTAMKEFTNPDRDSDENQDVEADRQGDDQAEEHANQQADDTNDEGHEAVKSTDTQNDKEETDSEESEVITTEGEPQLEDDPELG